MGIFYLVNQYKLILKWISLAEVADPEMEQGEAKKLKSVLLPPAHIILKTTLDLVGRRHSPLCPRRIRYCRDMVSKISPLL